MNVYRKWTSSNNHNVPPELNKDSKEFNQFVARENTKSTDKLTTTKQNTDFSKEPFQLRDYMKYGGGNGVGNNGNVVNQKDNKSTEQANFLRRNQVQETNSEIKKKTHFDLSKYKAGGTSTSTDFKVEMVEKKANAQSVVASLFDSNIQENNESNYGTQMSHRGVENDESEMQQPVEDYEQGEEYEEEGEEDEAYDNDYNNTNKEEENENKDDDDEIVDYLVDKDGRGEEEQEEDEEVDVVKVVKVNKQNFQNVLKPRERIETIIEKEEVESDGDLDIELLCDSEQILDFENSLIYKDKDKSKTKEKDAIINESESGNMLMTTIRTHHGELRFDNTFCFPEGESGHGNLDTNHFINPANMTIQDQSKVENNHNKSEDLSIAKLKEELEEKDKKIFDLQEEVDILEVRNQNLQESYKELRELTVKVQNIEKDLKSKDSEIVSQNREIKDLKSLNKELQVKADKYDEMINDQSSLKYELEKKQEKISELHARIGTLENSNDQLRDEIEKKNSQKISQNTEENYKSTISELKSKLDILLQKNQDLSEELFILKKNEVSKDKEIKQKAEQIEKLKNEVLNLTSSYPIQTVHGNKNDQLQLQTNNFLAEREKYTYNRLDQREREQEKEREREKERDKEIQRDSRDFYKRDNNNVQQIGAKSPLRKENNNIFSYDASNENGGFGAYEHRKKKPSNNSIIDVSTNMGTNITPYATNLTTATNANSQGVNYIPNNPNNISNLSNISSVSNSKAQRISGKKPDSNFLNFNVMPSETKDFKKESKIIELETKLMNKQKEKEQFTSELSKLPEFPKTKVQIVRKKDLELKVNEISQECNKYKQELRDLKSHI